MRVQGWIRRRCVLRSSALCSFVAGRLGLAVAAALMVQSTLGLGAWDAVVIGGSGRLPLSAGQSSAALAVTFVFAAWALGNRPTWGTIAASGLFSLAFGVLLPLVPPATSPLVGVAYYTAALVLCGLATACYLAADYGRSAYDGFVTALAARTRQSPTRWRAGLELLACATAWALGGPMGLGTVICTIAIAPSVAWGARAWPRCTHGCSRAATRASSAVQQLAGRVRRQPATRPPLLAAARTDSAPLRHAVVMDSQAA